MRVNRSTARGSRAGGSVLISAGINTVDASVRLPIARCAQRAGRDDVPLGGLAHPRPGCSDSVVDLRARPGPFFLFGRAGGDKAPGSAHDELAAALIDTAATKIDAASSLSFPTLFSLSARSLGACSLLLLVPEPLLVCGRRTAFPAFSPPVVLTIRGRVPQV